MVDDEPLARRNVTVLLHADPDIAAIEECGSGAEAITAIRSWQPDPVFLDVQMPECGGFDVIELLGAALPRVIVFVTAYDWIEAANYYTCLHVGRDTHIIRRTLAELARDLGEEQFIRIHRSTIVNLERIHGLELQSSGGGTRSS